ncbi:MAG: AAA family ATPase [Chloroflexi bacterium]|uniref:DnaB-like helicase C-terminal domain-containing protein n=1 Tax=Candidatus Flexifilum breve TaxID=3140694 RepID=UPI0031364091|nr:AAA family ATPase [Chloroflexota bacterium]
MTTRRFTEPFPPNPDEPSAENRPAVKRPQPIQPKAAPPAAPPPTAAAAPAAPTPERSSASGPRGNAHLPRTLTQVLNEADDRVTRGDLVDYVPLPTGFDPLDGFIGGGLRKTELVLLGGAQGIGKTIATLQVARNIAMRPDQYVFYLSYEHTETHLMHRLLCMESINPPEIDLSRGLKLRDLYQIIVAQRAKEFMGREGGAGSLQAILRDNPKTAPGLGRILRYADRMILVKASPAVTTLRSIKEMTARLCDATGGNVAVFIDYLQKIAVHPERPRDENDKVTIIVEGLKDIAMSLDVPVWAIVAADREGLKSKRIHLFHLRGSSALDYESDIALIMNNKYQIMSKDHAAFNPYTAKQFRDWVVWTIEKNRAGRAMQDMEFQLHGQHFAFDPRGQKVQQTLIDDKIIET